MLLGQRIKERARLLGLSQAEVGRRAGIKQSSINTLANSNARTTPHLIKLARVLDTSPAYLMGETDDPAPDAPLPVSTQPQVIHVTLPVALPSENALAAMFEGLLQAIDAVDRGLSVDEHARELAQLLPTGLSRIAGDLIELPRPPRRRSSSPARAATAEAPASAEPAFQR